MFQTLIGTVKSFRGLGEFGEGGGFQTLIGTVKSHAVRGGEMPVPEFQTLIGTVKRGSGGGGGPAGPLVSNPHRYGQKEALPLPQTPAFP